MICYAFWSVLVEDVYGWTVPLTSQIIFCPQDVYKGKGVVIETDEFDGNTVDQVQLVGPLASNDWQIVGLNATNDFLMDLSQVHLGWRGFQQKLSLFLRACWLALVFIPLILLGPVLYMVSTFLSTWWAEYFRCAIWVMLRFCLERGGAAFIKWGQVIILYWELAELLCSNFLFFLSKCYFKTTNEK